MFCKNCGSQNADGAAFCKNCGTKISVPMPTPAPAQAPVTTPAPTPMQPASANSERTVGLMFNVPGTNNGNTDGAVDLFATSKKPAESSEKTVGILSGFGMAPSPTPSPQAVNNPFAPQNNTAATSEKTVGIMNGFGMSPEPAPVPKPTVPEATPAPNIFVQPPVRSKDDGETFSPFGSINQKQGDKGETVAVFNNTGLGSKKEKEEVPLQGEGVAKPYPDSKVENPVHESFVGNLGNVGEVLKEKEPAPKPADLPPVSKPAAPASDAALDEKIKKAESTKKAFLIAMIVLIVGFLGFGGFTVWKLLGGKDKKPETEVATTQGEKQPEIEKPEEEKPEVSVTDPEKESEVVPEPEPEPEVTPEERSCIVAGELYQQFMNGSINGVVNFEVSLKDKDGYIGGYADDFDNDGMDELLMTYMQPFKPQDEGNPDAGICVLEVQYFEYNVETDAMELKSIARLGGGLSFVSGNNMKFYVSRVMPNYLVVNWYRESGAYNFSELTVYEIKDSELVKVCTTGVEPVVDAKSIPEDIMAVLSNIGVPDVKSVGDKFNLSVNLDAENIQPLLVIMSVDGGAFFSDH